MDISVGLKTLTSKRNNNKNNEHSYTDKLKPEPGGQPSSIAAPCSQNQERRGAARRTGGADWPRLSPGDRSRLLLRPTQTTRLNIRRELPKKMLLLIPNTKQKRQLSKITAAMGDILLQERWGIWEIHGWENRGGKVERQSRVEQRMGRWLQHLNPPPK